MIKKEAPAVSTGEFGAVFIRIAALLSCYGAEVPSSLFLIAHSEGAGRFFGQSAGRATADFTENKILKEEEGGRLVPYDEVTRKVILAIEKQAPLSSRIPP